MALSAAPLLDVVQRLKASPLKTAEQLQTALEFRQRERVLALGIPALDEVLPQRGLLQGSVIELQVHGASGAATSFALCACRAAQQASSGWGSSRMMAGHAMAGHAMAGHAMAGPSVAHPPRQWCAFVDPSASLFAPGVARLGVSLDRLLVVRPDIDSVERVAIRIAEAKAMSLLVIDLRGALGDLRVSSHRWQRTVRRLALTVKNLSTSVLLITPSEPRQALPLPVALRLEFARAAAESFEIRVGKERSGRISSAREVPLSAFEGVWQ